MGELLHFLIVIFLLIEICQGWLMVCCKSLIRGGLIIAIIETVEFPLEVYLILGGGIAGFLTVVFLNIFFWLAIAYCVLKK